MIRRLLFFAAAAVLLLPATARAQALNEVILSTSSIDTEFFEIAGEPGADLAGHTLLIVDSDTSDAPGTIDEAIAITGTIPSDGYWLAASPAAVSAYGLDAAEVDREAVMVWAMAPVRISW